MAVLMLLVTFALSVNVLTAVLYVALAAYWNWSEEAQRPFLKPVTLCASVTAARSGTVFAWRYILHLLNVRL